MRHPCLCLAASLVALSACSPELPSSSSGPDVEAELSLALDPPADLRDAPAVVRLRVSGSRVSDLDPSRAHLARGSLTRDNLEDLAAGFPSDALSERLVPVTASASGGALLVIPHVPLERGQRYTLGLEGEVSFELRVSSEPADVLSRAFPVDQGPGQILVCGPHSLGEVREQVALEPRGLAGTLFTGTPLGRARGCARFEPDGQPDAGVVHLPPTFAGRPLDPAPVAVSPPSAVLDAACLAGELRLGPGCVRVEDDRVHVRGPEAPTFWVVAAPGVEVVRLTQDGSSFVVAGLEPASAFTLSAESLSLDGRWRADDIAAVTGPARPRPVLNEVYADALGPEPEQEWVEILNDGTAPLELEGLVLEDVGGASAVPAGAGALEPGELVLLVGAGFDPSGIYDVPPAPGARVVMLEELGGNGLSNQGELLRLLGPSGELLSTFPSSPKPRPGVSVARTRPEASDDDPTAFVLAEPPTPGGAFVGAARVSGSWDASQL